MDYFAVPQSVKRFEKEMRNNRIDFKIYGEVGDEKTTDTMQ